MSYSKSAFAFKMGRGVGDKACKVAFNLLGSFDILFWVGRAASPFYFCHGICFSALPLFP